MRNGSDGCLEDEDFRDEELARWEIGILSGILLVTVLGNCLVLWSLYLRRYRHRQKMTRMYFFIMHLSVADLVTGLFDVLPQLAWEITFRFQAGPVPCKLVKFLQPLGPYLSSYVLMATAVDRHHAICHPLSYCRTTSRRARIMVYASWTISIALCVPQVFIFSYQEISENVWDCWATFSWPYGERAYVTWYSVTVFLVPFIVLVYTYTTICREIWLSNKTSEAYDHERTTSLANRNRIPIISRAMMKTVKQTIAVITIYVTTSTPFVGCLLWATWDPEAPNSQFFKGPTFTILTLLSSLTSCVNPWIYLSFNRELRASLVNCFRRKDDWPLTHERPTRRGSSNTNSTRSTLITRISNYASNVMFH